jgi:hypothetical protein
MAGNDEVSVPDYQSDVKYMIADTEREIFSEATNEELPENDGDTSLEEMDDPYEDDTEPDGTTEEEPRQQQANAPTEQVGGGEEEEQVEPDERDGRNWVPPSRLREESERRRAAETRYDTLQTQFNELSQRVMSIQPQQQQAPQRQAPEPEPLPAQPDRFADPDGFDRWQDAKYGRMLDDRIRQVNEGWQRELQNRETTRINRSLDAMARGPRGWEFSQAYQSLTSLPVTPENAAMVRGISESPNPGDALMEWWEVNGGEEFRQGILDQLADQYGFVPPSQDRGGGKPNGNGQQSPRHVTRLPAGMRSTRSLNDARGGRRQETPDPEMFDDSERSVFSFASRRG